MINLNIIEYLYHAYAKYLGYRGFNIYSWTGRVKNTTTYNGCSVENEWETLALKIASAGPHAFRGHTVHLVHTMEFNYEKKLLNHGDY